MFPFAGSTYASTLTACKSILLGSVENWNISSMRNARWPLVLVGGASSYIHRRKIATSHADCSDSPMNRLRLDTC